MKTQIISQFILVELLDLSFKRTSEVCFVLCVIFCFTDEKWKKRMKYMALEKIQQIFLAMSESYNRVKSGEITFTMTQNVSGRGGSQSSTFLLPFLYLPVDLIVQKTRLLQFTHSGFLGFFVRFVCKANAPGNNVIRTPFSLPMLSRQYKTCWSSLNTQVRYGNRKLGTTLFFCPALDNLQLSESYNMHSLLTQHALTKYAY